MRNKMKIWLVIGVFLVIAGLVLFAAAMWGNNWDFTKLNTVKYQANTHVIGEEFSNISMRTDTADISFMPAEDGICKIVCYEPENVEHAVDVQDDVLTMHTVDERQWYEYIGITVGTPQITVYLPQTQYASIFIEESTGDIEIPKDFTFESIDILASTGDVTNYASVSEGIKIKTSTGDIHVENIFADMLDLSVSTGSVRVAGAVCAGDVHINVSTGKAMVTDVKCKNIISDGDTGDLSLKNVIAGETCSIQRSTGDVKLDGCDAAEIFIETDTGDVTGSLLTDKVFFAQTDTGEVDVPKTATGGRCEITTDTGDIKITIVE